MPQQRPEGQQQMTPARLEGDAGAGLFQFGVSSAADPAAAPAAAATPRPAQGRRGRAAEETVDPGSSGRPPAPTRTRVGDADEVASAPGAARPPAEGTTGRGPEPRVEEITTQMAALHSDDQEMIELGARAALITARGEEAVDAVRSEAAFAAALEAAASQGTGVPSGAGTTTIPSGAPVAAGAAALAYSGLMRCGMRRDRGFRREVLSGPIATHDHQACGAGDHLVSGKPATAAQQGDL